MNQPLLSVVIPVATKRDGLKRCLDSACESLVKCPWGGQWTIAVKDSTTEGVMEVVRSISESMEEVGGVGYLRYPPADMPESWNQCWRDVPGRYVHILHDDDWVRPEFYPSIWPKLEEGRTAVCTGYEVEDERGTPMFENRVDISGKLFYPQLLHGNRLVPSCIVIERAWYENMGGYFSDGMPDWELYLRLAQSCGAIEVVPEFFVRQRRHPQSAEAGHGRVETFRALLETIRRWESQHGGKMPARDTYHAQALTEAVAARDVELFKVACQFRR